MSSALMSVVGLLPSQGKCHRLFVAWQGRFSLACFNVVARYARLRVYAFPQSGNTDESILNRYRGQKTRYALHNTGFMVFVVSSETLKS